MATKMFSQKEKEQLLTDLKTCESIQEDLENAKKAKIPGIEILQARLDECKSDLKAKYSVYGGRNQ